MEKGEWLLRDEKDRPEDLIISSALPMDWDKEEAVSAGFGKLKMKKNTLYSVAVGFNSDRNMVGAKIIRKYRKYLMGTGEAMMNRDVLQIEANKAFGLPEDTKPPSGE